MRRYYLSPIIGTGTTDDPYRAALDAVTSQPNSATSVIIATGPDGKPSRNVALCAVDADDHFPLLVDARLKPLPLRALVMRLLDMTLEERSDFKAKLQSIGIDTSRISDETTFGQILQTIGRRLEASFDLTRFERR